MFSVVQNRLSRRPLAVERLRFARRQTRLPLHNVLGRREKVEANEGVSVAFVYSKYTTGCL